MADIASSWLELLPDIATVISLFTLPIVARSPIEPISASTHAAAASTFSPKRTVLVCFSYINATSKVFCVNYKMEIAL